MLAFLTAATSIADGFHGAFGVGLVTSAAAAAGVGSIPTPVTEQGWDGWILHQYFHVHRGAAAFGDNAGVARFILDSKAMRKASTEPVAE